MTAKIVDADRWHVEWSEGKVELFAPDWKFMCGSRDSAIGKDYENIAATMNAALTVSSERPTRCPHCDSPDPKLHPAMQHEGEVQPCNDPWHGLGGYFVPVASSGDRQVDDMRHALELDRQAAVQDRIQSVMWAVFAYAEKCEAFTKATPGEERDTAHRVLMAQDDFIRGELLKLALAPSATKARE